MAITPSFVRVAPDSTGKFIDNVSPTNPDLVLVQRQVTATADPDVWGAIARVVDAVPATDAFGLVVRQVPPAAPADSGLVTLTATPGTAITASTLRVAGLVLTNLTTQLQAVNVTNTAGGFHLKDFPLQAKQTIAIAFFGATMVGVKAWAGNTSAVNLQVVGA